MAVLQRAVLLLLCWQTAAKKPVDRSYQLQGLPFPNGAQGLQFYASGAPTLLYPNIPIYIPGPVTGDTYQPQYRPSQQQSAASFSIEQSVDLSQQSLPSVPSTYGPPKTVDVPLMRRPTYRYHKHKHPRRPVIYTHMHKGHLHTHYLAPSSPAAYKPPKPAYLPPPPSTEAPDKIYNHHAYPTDVKQPSYPVGPDHTQAVIGKPGIINNFDANLPVKIPSPKPNLLEVKDILKNADLHFVDVLENQPTTPTNSYPQQEQYRHPPSSVYQQQQQQQYPVGYQEDERGQQLSLRPYAELYDQRYQIPQGYQSNHLEDSGSSDTIKIPVAVFKGILPGMFPAPSPVERSDEETSYETLPAGFTPSKRTSDWIPMTGSTAHQRPTATRTLTQFGDDYFSALSPKLEAESTVLPVAQKLVSEKPKTENKVVGDIISGRIPGGHNPFGTKPTGTLTGNVADGSNLVVSSVIKFSR